MAEQDREAGLELALAAAREMLADRESTLASTRANLAALEASYQSLDRCHSACVNALRSEDYTVLTQGDGLPRGRMLEEFRRAPSAVLFGTDSFWEGVDVPGRALRGLLLARVPFRVPTEPVTAAQCEAIESAGGDAFAAFMVPHAALRLKQGFGRLIRSATDRGAVVLCDSRVVHKSYGRALLAALPPARRAEGPWDEVRIAIREFYEQNGGTNPPGRGYIQA